MAQIGCKLRCVLQNAAIAICRGQDSCALRPAPMTFWLHDAHTTLSRTCPYCHYAYAVLAVLTRVSGNLRRQYGVCFAIKPSLYLSKPQAAATIACAYSPALCSAGAAFVRQAADA
jgi:hypothetical protein